MCSWCSWRHTPFRKPLQLMMLLPVCSWRHTPFRNKRVEFEIKE
ncbi:hypothetical protein J518_1317 [Acinetobacter baumannii 1419130]|nr:hypothetical protein J518_1317 [Acinetobacter baumannii 1419130]